MKSKYLKILISVVLIVSLSLAITVNQANAVPLPIVIGGAGLAVGGLVWALSSAMGVDLALDNFTSTNIGQAFDPWYNVQSTLTTSDFTFVKGLRTGFDGLMLSLSAFNAIKQAAINLIADEEITDDTSGTLGQVYNGIIPHQRYYITWGSSRDLSSTVSIASELISSRYETVVYYNNVRTIIDSSSSGSISYYVNPSLEFEITNNNLNARFVSDNYTGLWKYVGSNPSLEPTIDYNAGTVNPSFGQTALNNITVIFPQTQLPQAASLDDILSAINDLALVDDSNVSVEIDVNPSPPTPVPTTSLGDVPYEEWLDTFGQSVYDKLDEQTDAIDNYGQSAIEAIEEATDTIDTVGQDVVEAIESVDTNIQTGTGILSGIRTLVDSAVDTLEDIGEMIGELVEDIVLGTETLISGILNQIPSLFNVILSPIKRAASIWHYVVEWIQSIAGPFQFIWSMANGTSYYIVLPVYASLAAAVVLAFYKRFGK